MDDIHGDLIGVTSKNSDVILDMSNSLKWMSCFDDNSLVERKFDL